MSKKPDNRPALLHEALHTTYLVQDLFNRVVHGYDVVRTDPVAAALADDASAALGRLYQRLGELVAAEPDG